MTDAELVAAAIKIPDAFGAIVERYERLLFRFVKSLSSLSDEDAEDLLQKIFLKSYDHLRDFDPALKLSTWLMRIARNEVIDLWRREKNAPEKIDFDDDETIDDIIAAPETIASDLDKKMLSAAVKRVFAMLRPDFREALFLSYFEGRTIDEIADIVKKPPGTVASAISRAKKEFLAIARRTGDEIHFSHFTAQI